MRIGFIAFGILLLLLALKLCYNDAVLFKMTNFVCENLNDSWLVVHECRLRAISRQKITCNFNATLIYPVNDLVIKGQLFKRANGYKPWLYKAEIDCCRFLRRPYHPIAILIFKFFKDYSNFNHTCPYVGPVLLQGFYLNWHLLPHAIPTGDYLLALTWLFHNKTQISTNVYFEFKEDL